MISKFFGSGVLKAVVVGAGLSCFAHASFAQTQPPQEVKPVVTTVIGQPVRIDFQDGRVAVLKSTTIDAANPLSVSFQVFDSLCSDHRGMQCKYLTPYRSTWYFFTWEKNPDASKINQPLRFKNSDNNTSTEAGEIFESQSFMAGTESAFAPKLTAGMPTTKLVCDDFSWLPGESKVAPATAFIRRWDSEIMTENPETGVSENRTFTSAMNLQLSRVNDSTLEISSIKAFASSFGGITGILVSGDVSTLSLNDGKNGVCGVEIKPGGLSEAASNVQSAEERRTPPEKETNIYIYGSDEQSRAHQSKKGAVAGEIKNLLERFEFTKRENVQ
jgi:hypothetical protein